MDASPADAPPQAARPGKNSDPGKELFAMHRILVVDDEPLIRWAIRESLEGEGYAVVEAGTAREALAHLETFQPIAIALLDLRLPDCDDLSLLQRVRHEAPGCQVILMSAHGTPEILAQAIGAGAFATVAKPFDLPRVMGIVRAADAAA